MIALSVSRFGEAGPGAPFSQHLGPIADGHAVVLGLYETPMQSMLLLVGQVAQTSMQFLK